MVRAHQRGARRRAAGFSLVEFLIAAAIVGLAVLAHASGSLAGYHLARSEETRSVALQTVRQFLERLRADEDWTGMYARLFDRVDPSLVPAGTFHDPSAYVPDFVPPGLLGAVGVRVEVPYAAPAGGGPYVLREDATLPAYGLPYDLNGDGALDDEARNGDYRVLPVIVLFRWQAPGEVEQTLRVTGWLTGERP